MTLETSVEPVEEGSVYNAENELLFVSECNRDAAKREVVHD